MRQPHQLWLVRVSQKTILTIFFEMICTWTDLRFSQKKRKGFSQKCEIENLFRSTKLFSRAVFEHQKKMFGKIFVPQPA